MVCRIRLFIYTLVFLLPSFSLFADDVASGEKLFKQNCTACHMISDQRLVGPGLAGVTEKYEKEWLIKWIRNSQALIKVATKEQSRFGKNMIRLLWLLMIFQIKSFRTY